MSYGVRTGETTVEFVLSKLIAGVREEAMNLGLGSEWQQKKAHTYEQAGRQVDSSGFVGTREPLIT